MLVRYTLNRDTLLIKSTTPHPAVNVSSKFVKLMKELCVRDNSTAVTFGFNFRETERGST